MKSQGDPNIGQTLINRYKLMELIGQGSMGKVYRGEDQLLGGVTVAVKFLSQTLLNSKMKQRFADEARTGAQLGQRSIHIVRVLDYGVHLNESPFYVMEYMEGKNLSDLILPSTLPVKRFLRLMRHICLGLQCAHNGIKIDGDLCKVIHRDIKPSNVFVITDPGLGEVAKVLDFGIAKLFRDEVDSSQTRSFMGTLAYCSPEQIEGKELDGRSDIYSLGITMFEVLTGEMPIEPEAHSLVSWYKAHRDMPPKRFSTVMPQLKLPRLLEDMIMSCMAKSPDNRPQSMEEMLAVLTEVRDTLQSGQKTASRTTPPTQGTTTQETPSMPAAAKHGRTPTDALQVPIPQRRFLSVEDAGWSLPWPADKPKAEIVFPQIIAAGEDEAVALWVMLSRAEIKQRLLSTRYNHFLCLMAPHPMLLWVTAVYDAQLGARWLPCYLDLKQERSEAILKLLTVKGYYLVLFYALEDTETPMNVRTITILPQQRQLFLEWHRMAQQAICTGRPSVSKTALKAELERIKPAILNKLQRAKSASAEIIL
jgi:eukaryotic-like serine/threonine-protein kinase